MLKKKQFVCLLSVGAMVAVLAGCSNSGVKFKNPVTITVWTYYNGDQLETFDSLVDKFNEGEGKKMGVTVESSSQGSVNDLETNVLASAEGKVGADEMPNIFSAYADTAYTVCLLYTSDVYKRQEETLCRTLLDCYDSVHTSRYRRFWMKDSHEIMAAIPEEKKTAQMEAEKELFWKFLNQFGPLAVSEELAFTSLRALIMTVYSREKLGPDYATILRWMAQGVCSHIF